VTSKQKEYFDGDGDGVGKNKIGLYLSTSRRKRNILEIKPKKYKFTVSLGY
jgi:hypothetical protein